MILSMLFVKAGQLGSLGTQDKQIFVLKANITSFLANESFFCFVFSHV